jgi:hypothetical protein
MKNIIIVFILLLFSYNSIAQRFDIKSTSNYQTVPINFNLDINFFPRIVTYHGVVSRIYYENTDKQFRDFNNNKKTVKVTLDYSNPFAPNRMILINNDNVPLFLYYEAESQRSSNIITTKERIRDRSVMELSQYVKGTLFNSVGMVGNVIMSLPLNNSSKGEILFIYRNKDTGVISTLIYEVVYTTHKVDF